MKRLYTIYILFLFLTPFLLSVPSSANIPSDGRSQADAAKFSTGYPEIDLYYSQLENNTSRITVVRRQHLLKTVSVDDLIRAFIDGTETAKDTITLWGYFVHLRDNKTTTGLSCRAN